MPITNSTQNVSCYGWNGTNPVRMEVNATGHQRVQVENDLTIDTTGLATSTGQATGNAHLSAIETAVEGTLRIDPIGTTTQPISGSVSVSNLASDPATATLQTAGNSSLSTLAGAVDGTEMQVDIVSGSVSVSNLPSDPATATLQTTGNTSLSNIEASHYAEGDTIAASDTGVLIMGRNGTNSAKPIHITNNGDVEVEIADFVKGQATMSGSFPITIASDQSNLNIKINSVSQSGTYQNLQAGTSLLSGADTSIVDISNVKHINIVYEDGATSSFDGLDVLVSGNLGSNYNIVSQLYPTVSGSVRYAYLSLEVGGLDRIKLQNNSTTDTYTTVNASVFGSL